MALSTLTGQMNHSQLSEFIDNLLHRFIYLITCLREYRECKIFLSLLRSVPGLEEKIMNNKSKKEVHGIAILVSPIENWAYRLLYYYCSDFCTLFQLQKGASSARTDDTRSLKSAIIDWLFPAVGEPPIPPLSQKNKAGRGFNHEVTGALLCPAALDWKDKR